LITNVTNHVFDVGPNLAAYLMSKRPDLTSLIAILTRLETTLDELGAKLDLIITAAAAVNTSIDAAVIRVTTDVTALNASIVDLKAQIVALKAIIDAGGVTPENKAKLDALQTTLADLQAKVDSKVDPTLPPGP
jgi:hypothetical protein